MLFRSENNDNDSLLLYNMQFCILRVLKSNFLRMKEQQRSGDLVGLIYFPLNYSSIKSTESNVNDNDNNKDNNNNNNIDEDIHNDSGMKNNSKENK